MAVDAELGRLLKHAADAPPLHAQSVAEARSTFRRLTRERTPLSPRVPFNEVRVDGADGHLSARLYKPAEANEQELIVFFHGGGFVMGDLETHDPLCRRLAASARMQLLSVAYRLGPEHPYPAAYRDGVAAVNWASAQLFRDGRIYIAGDSAGANIAAWTGVDVCRKAKIPVGGLLLIYPNVAFAYSGKSRSACGEKYMLSQRDLDYFAVHFLQGSEDRSLLEANFDGLAPTILVTAAFDPLCDEGRDLARCMREAGVAVRELHFPNLIHGFANMSHLSSAAEVAVREIGAAVDILRRPRDARAPEPF